MPCLKIKLVTRISMLKRSIIKALFLQQNDRAMPFFERMAVNIFVIAEDKLIQLANLAAHYFVF